MLKSPSWLSKSRSRLLLGLLLWAGFAQSSVPLNNPRVRQLGLLLKCQCGCPYTVSDCDMTACHFAEPARERLLKSVEAGKSEKEILDGFVSEYGLKVLTRPPAEGFYLVGWIMPFAGVAGGLGLVGLLLQRYLRSRNNASSREASTDTVDKYRNQIDQGLGDIE
jgi:cytochrome c-type biogenesis protein CcmH/NrfF